MEGRDAQHKRVWGFPLNCTWVSLDECWRLVQNTKIYKVDRQDVEFALTVYIQSYPANIRSVWIYVAAFIDTSLENLGLGYQ